MWDLGALAKMRSHTSIPLATNTSITGFEDILAAQKLNAVDIILGDPHWWWGARGFQQLGKVCQTNGFGLGMHSPGELGVGLTAMVHAAAATVQLGTAIDTHYCHLVDDVIKGRVKIENGRIRIPDNAGLGVEVDYEKVQEY